MADVFISYKSEDRECVRPLVAALEAAGLSVWWDARIGAGSEWREEIEQELDAAACVLVAWSSRTLGREGRFVRDEASRAQRRDVLLPVLIENVAPPLGFGETQAMSLVGWRGDPADPRFQAVLAAARAIVAQEPRRPHAAVHHHPARSGLSRRVILAGGGALSAAAAGAGAWWWWPGGGGARSVAVLPFANLSGDPGQAYFSDGLAEELRGALARIPGLSVIARMSSEAVGELDASAAAARLGVADILTGSVRRSPSLIRVSAQLVQGANGVERWSETYDRAPGDALSVQSGIAQSVAQALSLRLGSAEKAALADVGTTNAAAYDLFLKAREATRQNDDEAAVHEKVRLAKAAIALDPKYAEPHALQASAMSTLAIFYPAGNQDSKRRIEEAAAVARRAIQLDPELPDGYRALAFLKKSQLDFKQALALYQRANSLAEDAPALIGYSFFLAEMGRADEATALPPRAIALDPLNPDAYAAQGNAQYFAGNYREAIAPLRKMMEIAPKRYYARFYIGLSHLWLGEPEQAMAEFRAMPPGDFFRDAGEAVAAARAGDRAASDRATAAVAKSGDTVMLASIHAQRGDAAEAFRILDVNWRERSADLAALFSDPLFNPIRPDPRFKALEAKLDFA